MNKLAIMTRAKRGDKKQFWFCYFFDSIKHLNANCVFAIRKKCFLLSYTYHFLTQEIEKVFSPLALTAHLVLLQPCVLQKILRLCSNNKNLFLKIINKYPWIGFKHTWIHSFKFTSCLILQFYHLSIEWVFKYWLV